MSSSFIFCPHALFIILFLSPCRRPVRRRWCFVIIASWLISSGCWLKPCIWTLCWSQLSRAAAAVSGVSLCWAGVRRSYLCPSSHPAPSSLTCFPLAITNEVYLNSLDYVRFWRNKNRNLDLSLLSWHDFLTKGSFTPRTIIIKITILV